MNLLNHTLAPSVPHPQPGVHHPQNPSEAATVLLCLPSSPSSLFAPSPCPGRCWLAGTDACLDRNAGGEEGAKDRGRE
ncbi:hypothetical protein CesoFtcFv8_005030 [Champsocephalus esox]|uniref:Uncharacterized protein n=1 Tax=Champsocephalus esox TaxID=159716 RepID=A0AAN8CNK6_9TELE|nr:hypothetical protein CesoFtcFv8_005030 [Champsocephalus esox]